MEERAARRGGARTARVGVGAPLPSPPGRLVSFGLAGALVNDLAPGEVVTATRVVDGGGATIWEGEPLVSDARAVVVASIEAVVDARDARAELARRTGAHVADLESAALARTGRLAGVLRVVSDSAAAPVGRLARAATETGETRWAVVGLAFVREPRVAIRAARNGRRALAALERAAADLAVRAG